MKLIRCHIEQFGGLQQYQLDFSPQLTTVKEPNGFGKTTLAAFIRTMFYGMPRAAKALEKNDRKRYQPWQGGLYGGWLEFEYEGTAYRIERSFGLTPKQDSFKLYTLTPFAPSSRFTENIGEEIFGLSAEGFERTTYLPQIHWSDSFVTSEIRAQLTNLVEHTSDAGDFDDAVQMLRTQRSKYMPYRGKGGLVTQLSEKISAIQGELYDLEHSRQGLSETNAALQAAEQAQREKQSELEAVRKEITESYRIVSENALAEQYNALETHYQELLEQQTAFLAEYPAGLPNDNEQARLNDAIIRREQAAAWSLHPNEQQLLLELEQRFSPGVPTPEQLHILEEDAAQLTAVKTELDAHEEALQKLHPDEKPRAPMVFALLAILFGTAGAFLYEAYHLYIYSYTALGNAAICLLAMVIAGIHGILRKRKIRRLTDLINSLQLTAQSLTETLRSALDPYFTGEYGFDPALKELNDLLPVYLQLQGKAQALDAQRNAHCAEADELITTLFSKYGLHEFTADHHGLSALRKLCHEQATLSQMISRTAAQLDQFVASYGKPRYQPLSNSGSAPEIKETTLLAELDVLQNTITQLHQTAIHQQAEADQRLGLEDVLSALQKQQSDALEKVAALDKAIEHLITARQNLSEKYVEPVMERLAEYMEQLMHIDPEAVKLDTECCITLERMGAQRELGYFSVGQIDMIALCMRLALVDILYGERTPLLILDDPFVNLDDDNLKAALELLDELSLTHQILYLTCHDSRCG